MPENNFSIIEKAVKQYFENNDSRNGNAQRIFHGRGGCFPGLQWCVIDVFAPIMFVTVFDEPPEDFEKNLVGLVQSLDAFRQGSFYSGLVIQHRYLEHTPSHWLLGQEPQQATAKRGDLQFHIRFSHKNVGFFLDMEPGREWLEQCAKGRSVLNLFAYTCAFSSVAQAAGAKKIVNVDMSSQALSVGRSNHHLNKQFTDNVQFMDLDILKSWSRIRKPGPYDVIIIDPPSFQKGSFVAVKDYGKVVRRIAQLAADGADILACLNAPELGCEFLLELFKEYAPECLYIGRLPCASGFNDVDEQKQLKLLHFRFILSECNGRDG